MLREAVVTQLKSRLARRRQNAGRINNRQSSIIDVALVVLADGLPRTYSEIFEQAVKRKLVSPTANEKTWYNSLQGYIERRIADGRQAVHRARRRPPVSAQPSGR
jgi:hypothetical protein